MGLGTEEWPGAVMNLVGAVKPGGWIELVEINPHVVATKQSRASELAITLMALGGEISGKDVLYVGSHPCSMVSR